MKRWALVLLALAPALAGCLAGVDPVSPAQSADPAAILPTTTFYQVAGEPTGTNTLGAVNAQTGARPFHTLEEVEAHLAGWATAHPGLVTVDSIGESREGRPLHRVLVTDAASTGPKRTVLIDGGHHGNENAGVEMSLYIVDFLLENRGNATVAGWLRNLEFHVVPIVNPDGYVAQTRGNALGVNLNRNYDVDFGNPLGASNSANGALAHALQRPVPSIPVLFENCGPSPFSEPESAAMRDLMTEIGPRGALYLSHHTPTNALAAPWGAANPPFPLPPDHDAAFEHVLAWTRENTDYRAGKAQWGNFSAGLPYAASGSSQDFYYAQYEVASFTLEVEIYYTSVQSRDYAQRVYLEPYGGLAHWMETTLPIPIYLIANAGRLAAWETPDLLPPLPTGVPPAPLPPRDDLVKGDQDHDGDPGDFFDFFLP